MAVVIEGLTKIVKKKPILSDVSLSLSGVYGLLGPNGAGKTTLMRIVAGLLEFNAGRVSLGDEPISTGTRVKRVNEIGYLPQEFMMYPELTMYEVLEHLAVLQGEHPAACRSKIEKVIEQVNLSSHINKKMRELSGGMRRVGIAMLLLREPSILLFDEPTAGLDIRERVRFRNLLKRLGHDHTIVISSHLVEDIEFLCTKIGVLDRGMVLFEGSPDELKQKAAPYTYELDVPFEELDSVMAANEVVQMSEEPSHVVVRVLSEEPIGRPVAPRLMDGYLALLKEAEAHG
ncbi:ABC transporter family protein [Geobacillus kaustophilus]|uniref:ABC transporter family protein n=1 Tax=Geobacillus kaustophilus TaxID=1462 RepID=A0A0D8BT11_GEOKU|nr:ATP-binding cassette domain-containing protein [Geobacillus kaustophilus]KJE27296.1 ABC transporter family protein [Geobacillus kaustophilus]